MTERTPAPGPLFLIQEFVNTYDVEDAADDLASPEVLRAWLAERKLVGSAEPISGADLNRAAEVREALRALLLANSGEPLDRGAVESLNIASRNARLVVRFDEDGGTHLEPDASGVDGALGRLLAIVYAAMEEETWPRLKACREDTCMYAFYDHSKNRSGAWCTMRVCGNRNKARAYRQRQKA
jgi:predicted RNA-binding Zn ribbon-like protein